MTHALRISAIQGRDADIVAKSSDFVNRSIWYTVYMIVPQE